MSTAEYEAFFDRTDTDKSGTLSFEELKAVLSKQGYKESQIRTLFNVADESGDGIIEKDEFLRAMGCAPPKVHKEAAMRTIFKGFDKNGDGSITREELQEAWTEMSKVLSDQDAQKLMGWVDKDGDNKISYEELLEYFKGSQ